jgi:hypothetical protein
MNLQKLLKPLTHPNLSCGAFAYLNPSNMRIHRFNRQMKPRLCTDERVAISKGFDSHLQDKYPLTQSLILHNCDNNFVYYNLCKDVFPNLKTVILDSPPDSIGVLKRFSGDSEYKLILRESEYDHYSQYWSTRIQPHVVPVNDNALNFYLHTLSLINPTFVDDPDDDDDDPYDPDNSCNVRPKSLRSDAEFYKRTTRKIFRDNQFV